MVTLFKQTVDTGDLSFCRKVFSDGTQYIQFRDDCNTVGFSIDKETVVERNSSSLKFKTKNERITIEYDSEQVFALRVLVNDNVMIDSVEFVCENLEKIMNSVGDAEEALTKLKLECEPEKSFNPRKNPFLPENRFNEGRINKLTDGHLNAFENDIMDSVERILDKANRYYWCGKISETELSDVVAYIVRDVIERRQK